MQLISKLNGNVERLTAHHEDKGKNVFFHAQPKPNPKGQNYNLSTPSTSHHEQAKAVTVLRSGKVVEKDFPTINLVIVNEREKNVEDEMVKKD